MIGTSAGTVAGALIGYLIAGDKGAAAGAGIGAAVGTVTGLAVGNFVAKKKLEYANEEDLLNAAIAKAQLANLDLAIYNKGLAQQVTDAEKEIVALKKKREGAKTRKANLQKKKAEVDQMLASCLNKLEVAKNELNSQGDLAGKMEKSAKGDHATTMNGEVEELKANIAELEKRTKDLASLSASMAV